MPSAWRKIPFLRWSFWRLGLGMNHLLKEWQVGDGREERLALYVEKHARQGDAADVLRVIDKYCYEESVLINVGDEKGLLLDAAAQRANPARILELGTYCGYSALRMALAAPQAHVYSIEFSAANAGIARSIHAHAGVADRITVVVGTLGDGGKTADALQREHGFTAGSFDFLFLDHAKEAYLPDLQLILQRGWLRRGAIAVADNVRVPGAPEYRVYMRGEEGKTWRTREHETHVEYQSLIRDLVLESDYLGG